MSEMSSLHAEILDQIDACGSEDALIALRTKLLLRHVYSHAIAAYWLDRLTFLREEEAAP
jgi:hypothetical protein